MKFTSFTAHGERFYRATIQGLTLISVCTILAACGGGSTTTSSFNGTNNTADTGSPADTGDTGTSTNTDTDAGANTDTGVETNPDSGDVPEAETSDTGTDAGVTTMGERYFGYFQEDVVEDPLGADAGGMYFEIPAEDGAIVGSHHFAFQDCQGYNASLLTGTRSQDSIAGQWVGRFDGRDFSGTFEASVNADANGFDGTYAIPNGSLTPNNYECSLNGVSSLALYQVAPAGNFQVFQAGTTWPAQAAQITRNGDIVSWNNQNVAHSVVTVFQVNLLDQYPDGRIYQTRTTDASFDMTDLELTTGEEYIVSVTTVSAFSSEVEYYSSRLFTY